MVVNGRVLPVSGGYVHALCCSRRRRLVMWWRWYVVRVQVATCVACAHVVSPRGAVALGGWGGSRAGVEPQVGAPELTTTVMLEQVVCRIAGWCCQACVLCG